MTIPFTFAPNIEGKDMKFIESEKYRRSTMTNQSEVVQSGKNDLSKFDFTLPPKSAAIKSVRSYIQIAVLTLTCFASYYPILFNDFLYYWDDQWQVMNRYTEGGINLNNLWAIFSEFHGGQYSPVNATIYLFLYSIFGYSPMVFHLLSLLIHVGCTCLAYIIIIRISSISTETRLKSFNLLILRLKNSKS